MSQNPLIFITNTCEIIVLQIQKETVVIDSLILDKGAFFCCCLTDTKHSKHFPLSEGFFLKQNSSKDVWDMKN